MRNTWRLNNMLLKTNGSMKISKRKSEETSRKLKIKTQLSKSMGHSKGRKVYNDIGLP